MAHKYNIVYKTTNIINGKTYIGVHSTNNINDGYIGNGIRFNSDAKYFTKHRNTKFSQAVCDFGYKNFIREILFFFDSAEEAYAKEAELVDEKWVNDDSNYNMSIGGRASVMSKEGRERVSKKMKENNPYHKRGNKHHPNTIKSVSEKGKNSRFVTNGKETIKIYGSEEIPFGWYLGVHKDSTMVTAKIGTKNPNYKGIWVTPIGSFFSAAAAASAMGVNPSTIRDRCIGWRYQHVKGRKYKQFLPPHSTVGYEFIPKA